MKNLFPTTLILIILLVFTSCSSDSSQDEKNCIPIICKNGGVPTTNCGCDCPNGYTGTDCSTQKTPSKILITKIKVTMFPNKNNTDFWDVSFPDSNNALADIYVAIENSTSIEVYRSSAYYANSLSNGTNYFDFTPVTPINITSINSSFLIKLYDYDNADSNINDGVDDLMGFKAFNIYNSTGGFPTTIKISNDSTPIRFELTVSYVW